MSKITLKDDDIYLAALDKLNREEYIEGISLLYRSANSEMNVEEHMSLAHAYYNIEQYPYALSEMFLALSVSENDREIWKDIINCFMMMGQTDEAFYYIKCGIDKGILDDDDLDDEDYDLDTDSSIEVVDKRDNADDIRWAHNMIIGGEIELAKEVLENIGKDSYQYVDALNFLTTIALFSNDLEKARTNCDEILKIQPNNIMALCQKFTVLDKMEKIEERDEIISQLSKIKTNEPTDLSKMAVSFKMIGDHATAAKCYEKIIARYPYDRDYLICVAQAEYNCAEYDKAKKYAVNALRLYPFDAVVEFYAREISARNTDRKFDLLPIIPADETIDWISELKEMVKKSPSALQKLINSDKTYDMKIRWVFQNDFYEIGLPLIKLLIKMPRYGKYFKEYLINPFGNLRIKEEIIYAYMSTFRDFDKIIFSRDYKMCVSKPRISVTFRNDRFFPAYCKTFARLVVDEEKFITKLNKAFGAVLEAEKKFDFSEDNINAISAVMLKKVLGRYIAPEHCCQDMNCDMTDFKVFNELIYGK